MAYLVKLEAFHGPLDLLLYLIEEHQVDIYDIPIASITEQYLAYLTHTGDYDLDRLGDFLVMASYLLHLKSRMLLPRRPADLLDPDDEAQGDPREELVKRLLAYKHYRQAARHLAALEQGEAERIFFREAVPEAREEEIVADLKTLVRAYRELQKKLPEAANTIQVPAGDINVSEKMEELERMLAGKRRGILFHSLFASARSRRELLAYFLAMLELMRQNRVRAVQEHYQGDIKIYLRVGKQKHVDAQ